MSFRRALGALDLGLGLDDVDVGADSSLELVDLIEDSLPVGNKVSRIWGDTKVKATDRDLRSGASEGRRRAGDRQLTALPSSGDRSEPDVETGIDAAVVALLPGDLCFAEEQQGQMLAVLFAAEQPLGDD